MEIPIFIIVHDRLECLKQCVSSIIKYMPKGKIIFHDVCSTYKPLLEYLENKKEEGYVVYRSEINHHHTVLNSIKDYLEKNRQLEYYCMTDPDICFENCKDDILDVYIHLLNKTNSISVGPMLVIDDIPDHYQLKKDVISRHSKFWNSKRYVMEYKGKPVQYIMCMTDTTFQLCSAKRIPKKWPHPNSIRVHYPYCAKHLDWYLDFDNLSEDQDYYFKNTTKIAHWGSKKWYEAICK